MESISPLKICLFLHVLFALAILFISKNVTSSLYRVPVSSSKTIAEIGMTPSTTITKNRPPQHPQNHNRNNSDNRRVHLITGVAGYIGSHMALSLLERGETVVGLDNMSRGSQHAIQILNDYPNFHMEYVDLGDHAQVDRIFRTYHITDVFHFAAVAFVNESFDNPTLYRHNITYNTELLVDTMILYNVPRLIYSSTCAVYGNAPSPITEQSQTIPISPYGRAKLDAEQYIRDRATRQTSNGSSSVRFQARILRYFNVIGSHTRGKLREFPHPSLNGTQYSRLWSTCLNVIHGHKSCIALHESKLNTPDGTAIRDYIHVDDLVDAHWKVLLPLYNTTGTHHHHNESGSESAVQVYNVGTGKPTSTLQFIQAAERVTGKTIPICSNDNPKTGNAAAVYASGNKLRHDTGWKPTYTTVDSMLETAWRTLMMMTQLQ